MSKPDAVLRQCAESIANAIEEAQRALDTADPEGAFHLQVICEVGLTADDKSIPTPVAVMLLGCRGRLTEAGVRLTLGAQACEPARESDCGHPDCDLICESFSTLLDDGPPKGDNFSLN